MCANTVDVRNAMKHKEQSHCINCGGVSHCEETLVRKEIETIKGKIVDEHILDTCKKCECEECEPNED